MTMNCLGIFAKHPEPGQVKTRLARETSAEWAAAVAHAFLRDTIDRLREVPAQRVLAFSPSSARDAFAALAGQDYLIEPQGEGDLGQRLREFLAARHASGCKRTVIVGTDSPTLPVESVVRAFDMLRDADVVLGPATDGGYYLLGCAEGLPPIFEGIAWSGPSVLEQTIKRLEDTSLRLVLLPPWYDVDTLADWHTLAGHVMAMRRAAQDPRAPHTERLVLDRS
jgi:rSAM/selenodomain-associated transferase 1